MADFADPQGNNSKGLPSALLGKKPLGHSSDNDWRDEVDPSGNMREKSRIDTDPDDDYRIPDNEDVAPRKYLDDILRDGKKPSRDGRKESTNDEYNKTPMEKLFGGQMPEGTTILSAVRAKNLIKSDIVGKSDPYVVLSYGKQKKKSEVAKNTQNPEWNFEAGFQTPDGDDDTVALQVFDKDKIGRDKSLGNVNLPIKDVIAMDGGEGKWIPLTGVKSGEILLMSDFVDSFGRDLTGQPSSI